MIRLSRTNERAMKAVRYALAVHVHRWYRLMHQGEAPPEDLPQEVLAALQEALASGTDEEFIAALRTPEVFEFLVDRLPACVQKDLLKVWGYVHTAPSMERQPLPGRLDCGEHVE